MNRRKAVTAAAILLVLCCLLACTGGYLLSANYQTIYDSLLENTSLQVGAIAPDFELPGIDGETITLRQFRGQPTILTIGATWCPDCIREAPLLQELHENYPGINILMVDVKEDLRPVMDFREKYHITYFIAMDPEGMVYDQYMVFAIPTLIFIDEKGIVRAKIVERVTAESLDALLKEAGIIP